MNTNQRAFTLVELSIVLVILGLLIGGVLTGQSLIRAAELRAVSTEYSRYVTAVQTYRDKYFALPGDMTNATAYWGKDNTNCTADTGTAATGGTCNGNGNGVMNWASGAGTTGEIFQFWKQLALAGLIEGNYTGLNGSGGSTLRNDVVGTNVPRSRAGSSTGWDVSNSTNNPGDANFFAYDYGNYLLFGGQTATADLIAAVLKPEDAFNIDTKVDDGKPRGGKLIAGLWPGCTTAASSTDAAAAYKLTSTALACNLYFVQQF